MWASLAVVSFVTALGAIPLMIRLAHRFGIIDKPTHRKIHTHPVPYLGGAAILLGLTCAAGVRYFFDAMTADEFHKLSLLLGAAGCAFLLGLFDDKFKLRPRYKLFGQIAVAMIVVGSGYYFRAVTLPGLGTINLFYLGIPVTLLWILAVVNAMNLIDGVDGLAGSVMIIMLTFAGLMAVFLHDFAVAALMLCTAGAVVAFLIFNWRPAKIYMGDCGSLGVGMLLATSLVSLGQNPNFFRALLREPATEPVLYHLPLITAVAAYPLIEISVSVFRRMLRGKPIGSADKGHIHHRLLNRGWSPSQISFAAMLFSSLAGAAVIYSMLQYRGVAVWFLVSGAVLLGAGVQFCGFLDSLRPSTFMSDRPHFLIANHFISMQTLKLDYTETLAELHALITQTCVELGVQDLSLSIVTGRDQEHPAEFNWQRPPEAQASLVPPMPSHQARQIFSDSTELSAGSHAEWRFEPNSLEEDLDVEYRVLMSDFMSKALSRAEDLYAIDRAGLKASVKGERPLSSTSLRRRASTISPTPDKA
jgi:UDP-GlcNAc:undecaprenyl-phosphate/decaprenyl-phosphate GlcNAc-1-phosphate transferase